MGPSPGEDNQTARAREKIKCLKNMKKAIAASPLSLFQTIVQHDLRLDVNEKETKAPGKAEGQLGHWAGAGPGCWLAGQKDHVRLVFPSPKE